MDQRAAFDPELPFDAMAETIRRGVVDLVLSLDSISLWHDVPEERRLDCAAAGLMTGAVGVLMCFADESSHGELLELLANYLPEAAANARDIAANGAAIGASE